MVRPPVPRPAEPDPHLDYFRAVDRVRGNRARRIALGLAGMLTVSGLASLASTVEGPVARIVCALLGAVTGGAMMPVVVSQFLPKSGDSSGNLNVVVPATVLGAAGAAGAAACMAGVPTAGLLGLVPGALLGLFANRKFEDAQIEALKRRYGSSRSVWKRPP